LFLAEAVEHSKNTAAPPFPPVLIAPPRWCARPDDLGPGGEH
jgi:hypothetical protein